MSFLIPAGVALIGVALFAAVAYFMLRYYRWKTNRQVTVVKMRAQAIANYTRGLPYFEHEYRSKYRFITNYIKQNADFVGFAPMERVHKARITNALSDEPARNRFLREIETAPDELVALYKATAMTSNRFAQHERPTRYYFEVTKNKVKQASDKIMDRATNDLIDAEQPLLLAGAR